LPGAYNGSICSIRPIQHCIIIITTILLFLFNTLNNVKDLPTRTLIRQRIKTAFMVVDKKMAFTILHGLKDLNQFT
jgi:hypothetical protein